MNRIGIFYAYWERNWQADFFPYVKKVKNLGFDHLEVHAHHLSNASKEERSALRKEADEQGVSLSYCMGLPQDLDVSSPNEKTRLAGIVEMKKIIDNIAEIGGGVIGGIVYSYWPATLKEGQSKEQIREISLKSMLELAPYAAERQVILNIEVLNRFEHFLFNTAAEARSFAEEVNSPGIGILLDSFHMNIEEESFTESIRTAGKYLKSYHLGENNRIPPEENGHMPWQEIATALQEIDYQGPLVMEPFVRTGGLVGQNIAVHRDLIALEDMDRAVQKSVAFLREVFSKNHAAKALS